MKRTNQLAGKWEFVGAEKFTNSQWIASNNFVAGMLWEFTPRSSDSQIEYGVITEHSTQQSALAYIHQGEVLTIDTSTDRDTETSSDIYKIVRVSTNTISISITNEESCPSRYFRYILRKLDNQAS